MKRMLSTFVLLIAFLFPVTSQAAGVWAQTPVATADPFTLPINQLILRITEGNGYAYARNPSGALVYENVYMVDDGVVDDDILPATRTWYEDHDVQDLYLAYVRLYPEEAKQDTSGVAIQIRLATLPDTGAAARLVPDALVLMFEQQFEGPTFAQDIAPIEDVPDHDEAIIGVTGTDVYYGVVTGEPTGFRAPFTRFIAQSGTTVASIKVTSLDPAFNDALARELLMEQMACLAVDTPCLPIPLPSGLELIPATPSPSPNARFVASVRPTTHYHV
jgi:hypothetical protein